MPYPCSTAMDLSLPTRWATVFLVSGDNGAAPQHTKFKDDKSYLSTKGCLARKTINGGTANKTEIQNKTEYEIYVSMTYLSIIKCTNHTL